MLPAISNKIVKRPGNVPASHFIPNDDIEFWDNFYTLISEQFQIAQPIEDIGKWIEPYFARFGYRWHPVAGKPRYFHIGIDVHTPMGMPIAAIADGKFEYSGYAPLNGNYVVISHPQIATEDGFVLNSIYMHCQTVAHRFNIFQKLCRKCVSKKPGWANIPITQSDIIATVGDTGIEGGYPPHLHLQFDFVSADGSKRLSVDPCRIFKLEMAPSLTSEIRDFEDFQQFYKAHEEDLSPWEKYVKSYKCNAPTSKQG